MNDSEYQKLYDSLRRLGYRKNDQFISHLMPSVGWIIKNLTFNSVLDVGSSSGGAIGLMEAWANDKKKPIFFHGIDISMLAVIEGFALGREIICGSVNHLPYKDNAVDLVVSSDTLEHIEPEDVDQAISEIVRVAKKFIFMQISVKEDVARWKRLIGKPLHRTIKPLDWWLDKFMFACKEIVAIDYEKSSFCIEVESS